MELKQAFIVNKDLVMRAGKIAGQCCHGETLYMRDVMLSYNGDAPRLLYERYVKWKKDEVEPIGVMTKIIKKATYREMLEIMHTLDKEGDIKYYPVCDLGRTQIEARSLTCICVEPLEQEIVDELFSWLKLL